MLEYDKFDISEGIDVNKTNLSKECELCHYWFLKDIGFKYEPCLCNGCQCKKIWVLIMLLLLLLKEMLREFIFGIWLMMMQLI